MAEGWIKLRTNLFTDPRIARVSMKLKQPRAAVVGAFAYLWSIADEHDGVITDFDSELFDHEVGIEGFSAAAVEVDWLQLTDSGAIVREEVALPY